MKNSPRELTSEWFLWYGLHLGLSYREAMAIPLSLLLDIIAVEQIKMEGFEYVGSLKEQQMQALDFLSLQ